MPITRRHALKTLAAAAFTSTAIGKLTASAETPASPAPAGPYKLPPLSYDYAALEPHIDAETMHLHHDKHHKAYVTKLNEALAKEPSFAPPADVDDLVKNLSAVPESIRTVVHNQGGGHANHSLFWQALHGKESPSTGMNAPKSELDSAITAELGGVEKLKAEMLKQGAGLFGSGWVWLVLDGGKKLTVMTTPNQDSTLTDGHYPLFGLDVWEHAYYLKYKNVRADYLAAIWNVLNWNFISDRYAAAMKS